MFCLSCSSILVVPFLLSTTRAQWNLGNKPQWEASLDSPAADGLTGREKRASGYTNYAYNPRDDGKCPWYRWDNKTDCPPDSPFQCYEPPYWPYDEIHIEIPNVGIVVGRSMSYAQYRYINKFIGVPYARAPVYERKYKVNNVYR